MLQLEDDFYHSYTVVVSAHDGRDLSRIEHVPSTTIETRLRVVSVSLSSQLFNPGLYSLELFGEASHEKLLLGIYQLSVTGRHD
jgi:hypothetical protein